MCELWQLLAEERRGRHMVCHMCISTMQWRLRLVLSVVSAFMWTGLAATSTAWWICTCGTPCACLCVLRQGAATVHTFSLAVLAIPVGFLFGMVGCLLRAWLPTTSTARGKCTGSAPSPWSCICMQGLRTVSASLGCPRLLCDVCAAHSGLGFCTVVH